MSDKEDAQDRTKPDPFHIQRGAWGTGSAGFQVKFTDMKTERLSPNPGAVWVPEPPSLQDPPGRKLFKIIHLKEVGGGSMLQSLSLLLPPSRTFHPMAQELLSHFIQTSPQIL